MKESLARTSILVKLYQRYLSDGDTPQLIANLAKHYTNTTLERMLLSGTVQSQRAAALALGLLGNASSIRILGPYLRSQDRRLRMVVDDALRAIASREGSSEERQLLEQVIRFNECGNFEKAYDLATKVIEQSGGTAEFYHQRSLALFQLDLTHDAIKDCHECLKINRFHYAAMIGLGHCNYEMGYLLDSLYWFRQALDVNPDLEPIRLQILRLEQAIQES